MAARSSLCGTNNISLGAIESPRAAIMHVAIMPPKIGPLAARRRAIRAPRLYFLLTSSAVARKAK
jgi:hypothetical protein